MFSYITINDVGFGVDVVGLFFNKLKLNKYRDKYRLQKRIEHVFPNKINTKWPLPSLWFLGVSEAADRPLEYIILRGPRPPPKKKNYKSHKKLGQWAILG